ncbi:MAG TPA: PH domain-containing protein [Nitrososphaerales archaeon]|nr:PH domain-containing protein [Nitrososphaerales archaeon]
MFPAGFTSESPSDPETVLKLRPRVTKTFLKGLIAIGVFSIFLEITPANFVHYLIFLALSIGVLLIFVGVKHETKIEISEDGLRVKRLFRAVDSVSYQDIMDISVSQGMLARRFDCGTVFIILKSGSGSVRLMGGGAAEQLEDVPGPSHVYDLLSSRLSPFGGSDDDLEKSGD